MRLDYTVGFLVATSKFILHEDFKDLSWGFVLSHLLDEVEKLQNLRGYRYRMLKFVKGSIDFYESLNCFDVCCKVLLGDQIICVSCINRWYLREAIEVIYKLTRFSRFLRRSAFLDCELRTVRLSPPNYQSAGGPARVTRFFKYEAKMNFCKL